MVLSSVDRRLFVARIGARGTQRSRPPGRAGPCFAGALGAACLSQTSLGDRWSLSPAFVSLLIYVCPSLTFLPLVHLSLMTPFAFEFLCSLSASLFISFPICATLFSRLLLCLSLPWVSVFLSLLPSLTPALSVSSFAELGWLRTQPSTTLAQPHLTLDL